MRSWRRGATIAALLGLASATVAACEADRDRPLLIAHAGGGIDGKTYTNSMEALDRSYANGLRYFEVDLNWTSDGKLVLVHDWDRFGASAPMPPTLARFREMASPDGLRMMTADDLLGWLGRHRDARAVTDVKAGSVEALGILSRAFGAHRERLVPQIYDPGEYVRVRELGFHDVIFTLYRSSLSDAEVVAFATSRRLFAVTMPLSRVSGLAETLRRNGVCVYVHTVNSREEWRLLRTKGVWGVYTDFLGPGDVLAE